MSENTATAAVDHSERTDLLVILDKARYFLRFTVRDLTDDQARQRTTASELTLGGLIKHVTRCERDWAEFIRVGTSAMKDFDAMTGEDWAQRSAEFQLLPAETLQEVLDEYARVAARTDELVRSLPDLNITHPLPKAPWFADESWSARRVLMHIVSETSQHAGHADIIRESLDGAKSMG